jgi:hypothetical protein
MDYVEVYEKKLEECTICGMMDDSLEEDSRGLAVCPWCYTDEEGLNTLDIG